MHWFSVPSEKNFRLGLMKSKAALSVYETVRAQGTQQASLADMQERAELYDVLGYQAYEDKLDELFSAEGLKTGKD